MLLGLGRGEYRLVRRKELLSDFVLRTVLFGDFERDDVLLGASLSAIVPLVPRSMGHGVSSPADTTVLVARVFRNVDLAHERRGRGLFGLELFSFLSNFFSNLLGPPEDDNGIEKKLLDSLLWFVLLLSLLLLLLLLLMWPFVLR